MERERKKGKKIEGKNMGSKIEVEKARRKKKEEYEKKGKLIGGEHVK